MIDAIKTVIDNKRFEITLTAAEVGKSSDKLTEDSGFHLLTEINLLRISRTSLTSLPDSLGGLKNLVNLICQNNKLTEVPSAIGSLPKLKVLDLSSNELTSLPQELGNVTSLTSINVSCNKLTLFPDLTKCEQLAILDASYNQLDEFPHIDKSLSHLAEITLSENKISCIPAKIGELQSLKSLIMENNQVIDVPGNLNDCTKLKIVKLNGNKLKDHRFRKLVENSRTKPDQIMKYIKQTFKKPAEEKSPLQNNESSKQSVVPLRKEAILTIEPPHEQLYVKVSPSALEKRTYMVCCVVKGMDVSGEKFKKFIVRQNVINSEVCRYRISSTIATHDFSKVNYKPEDPSSTDEGLLFTTKDLTHTFKPLKSRANPVTIRKFLVKLEAESEVNRKDVKRDTPQNLYKYLDLVKGWKSFPVFLDCQGKTLSVPPITNGDDTQVTPETTELLLEVSSHSSLKECKVAMTALIQACMDFSASPSKDLTIQQVKVVAELDHGLRCMFPASDDLNDLPKCKIVRPY